MDRRLSSYTVARLLDVGLGEVARLAETGAIAARHDGIEWVFSEQSLLAYARRIRIMLQPYWSLAL